MSYTKWIQELNDMGFDIDTETGASASTVEELEKCLDVTLPPSYKDFLLEVGMAYFPGQRIFSGILNDKVGERNLGEVYGDTLDARNKDGVPHHLIPINARDESWHYYCLDTSKVDENGECPVVSYNYMDHQIEAVFDPSYKEFFWRWVKMWLDDPGFLTRKLKLVNIEGTNVSVAIMEEEEKEKE